MVFSTILVSRSLQTEKGASVSYIPKDKVERVSALMKEWSMRNVSLDHKVNIHDKGTTNFKELVQFIDQFSCNQRIKNIIYTSSIKILKKYPSITAEKFIESIRRYYDPFTYNKCIEIIQDIDVIYRINHRVTGKESDIKKIGYRK